MDVNLNTHPHSIYMYVKYIVSTYTVYIYADMMYIVLPYIRPIF